MEVFWRRGYEATSVDDLTRAMDIGRASLYHSFGDKRGVLQAALEAYASTGDASLRAFVERNGPARAIIEDLLAWHADDAFTGDHPRGCFLLAMCSELRERDRAVVECSRQGLDRLECAFRDLLRRAQADGSIGSRVDIRRAALVLTGVVVSIRTLARAGGALEMASAMLAVGRRQLDE